MKKITLANPKGEVIKFLARGQRGSSTAVELVIDAKGVVAQDADAALAKERLGSSIVVEDIDAKAAAKAVTDAVNTANKPTAEEIAAEEARRAALTDEEREAEDKAKADAEEKAKADAKAKKEADKAAKKAAKEAGKTK